MKKTVKLEIGSVYRTNSGARVTVAKRTDHGYHVIEENSKLPVAATYNEDGRVSLDPMSQRNPLTIVSSVHDKRVRFFCQFPNGRLYGPPCSPVSWPDYRSAFKANGTRIAQGKARIVQFAEV